MTERSGGTDTGWLGTRVAGELVLGQQGVTWTWELGNANGIKAGKGYKDQGSVQRLDRVVQRLDSAKFEFRVA